MGRRDHGGPSWIDIRDIAEAYEDGDDGRDAFAILQERIDQYRTAGWRVPDELIRVERQMMTEFMAEAPGR